MSASLHVRPEIAKLASLLDREPADLAYLEKCSADDVRALRDQVTDLLFDSDRHAMQRIATASKVVPVKLVATLGERVFGPLLCARVARRGVAAADRVRARAQGKAR
jgi:hypothetical protein